jgi:hypothetical protein
MGIQVEVKLRLGEPDPSRHSPARKQLALSIGAMGALEEENSQ